AVLIGGERPDRGIELACIYHLKTGTAVCCGVDRAKAGTGVLALLGRAVSVPVAGAAAAVAHGALAGWVAACGGVVAGVVVAAELGGVGGFEEWVGGEKAAGDGV